MMGYLVKDNMPKEEQNELESKLSWIDPKLVSVWEIEKDKGTIKSIQSEDGLIENNYFDNSMKLLMNDFYSMLNYYGDED
jgi:hypothetical protein